MSFEVDILALFIAGVLTLTFYVAWHRRQQFERPSVFFSDLKGLTVLNSWKVKIANLPSKLEWISLLLFLLAFMDPHFQIAKPGAFDMPPMQGISIYIVADQSGSMGEIASSVKKSKMELAKEFMANFISGRPDDLIGLVSFARIAQILVPLTLDHETLLESVSNLNPVQDKSEDGTAMGYAIFKTVNVIASTRHYAEDLMGTDIPAYKIKNQIIVLVTDGFQSPNPLDQGKRLRNMGLVEAAQYAKDNGVRLYVINVDPNFSSTQFNPHRNLMNRITEMTGGQFYMASDPSSLKKVFEMIDKIEKSKIPDFGKNLSSFSKDQQPHRYQRVSIYPVLIGIGMILLIIAMLLKTTVVRTIP